MTRIIAHRGASRAERENTTAAFRRAGEMGADGVELDVRRTADDHLVVHHDAVLADGRAIRAMTTTELPDHVPTILEALDACVGMFVNIEIKNDPDDPDFDPTDWVANRLAADLAVLTPHSRWLISSFRLATVDACRRLMPSVPTAWLVGPAPADVIATTASRGHGAVHPWDRHLTFEMVRAAHAVGLAVNTWTCDDPERMRELIAWGVDGICTNVPDVALGVRRETSR
ncbi:MAG: glycerophosphodiester phosphodiesterase [Ilumatobacteraceae bacterium]|nr:glycerophosphodiester phosphodiesterase [Ilumatobacteraceae bacterium]